MPNISQTIRGSVNKLILFCAVVWSVVGIVGDVIEVMSIHPFFIYLPFKTNGLGDLFKGVVHPKMFQSLIPYK